MFKLTNYFRNVFTTKEDKTMSITSLSLYHYDSCPYCARTKNAIDKLNINVELRNIHLEPSHSVDLLAYGGKIQVPCLLIENEDGKKDWLYESNDIIYFLNIQEDNHKQVA
jgi:glutaredoxin 2